MSVWFKLLSSSFTRYPEKRKCSVTLDAWMGARVVEHRLMLPMRKSVRTFLQLTQYLVQCRRARQEGSLWFLPSHSGVRASVTLSKICKGMFYLKGAAAGSTRQLHY